MSKIIKQRIIFTVNPHIVFEALMDSKKHASFSNKEKASIGRTPGSRFSAYSGYVEGFTLATEKDKKIVQAWRGSNWPKNHYSLAIFEFNKKGKGTELIFTHINVPEKEIKHITEGWKKAYWEPMQKMFLSKE